MRLMVFLFILLSNLGSLACMLSSECLEPSKSFRAYVTVRYRFSSNAILPLPYRYRPLLTATNRYRPLLTVTQRYPPFLSVTCNGEERLVTVTVGNGR
jgi:hypothetical protein